VGGIGGLGGARAVKLEDEFKPADPNHPFRKFRGALVHLIVRTFTASNA